MRISHALKFFSFLNFIYFHYARLSTFQVFCVSHKGIHLSILSEIKVSDACQVR